MEPVQKGLLLGVLSGAVLSLLTWQVSWMAAGVLLGVGVGYIIGRRRRSPKSRLVTSYTPGLITPAKQESPVRPARPRPEVTPERREDRLRGSSTFWGTRMLEGRTNRDGALEQIRDTVSGFPPERYEAELDEALVRIEEYRVSVWARRAKLVEDALEMDALHAVFALQYFNGRFSGHVGQYGLGPINLFEALGDLYSQEVIEEAISRAGAMISEGISMGIGSWDHDPNMTYLRQAHPGFSDKALGDALDWGHLIYR